MREALLSMLHSARGIAGALGLRTITVALRTEDSVGGAFGTSGAVTVATDTPLVPQPKVRRIGDDPSFEEAGDQTRLSAGRLGIYRIGPITPRSLAGTGYDLGDLRPETSTPSRRCVLVLSGQEIGDTPVPFEILADGFDQTALHIIMNVRQVQAL